ncbi:MAG: ArsB/NhaD family transporter [Deltaproteobacteria bacterium]|nr:ArsB/NhaD family transporter [Deltaproteobacteria bacterium]
MQLLFVAAIFIIAFIIITFEWFNKTTVVLAGAVLYIATGIIDQDHAFAAVDWNVIFLLVGMMIIVGITRGSGLFQYVAIKAAKSVKGDPIRILILLSIITAVFSALLDNVTTVLIITPISILIAVELGLSPIPFVVSNAIASNIGGTATLIGDPPNILIGSATNLSFMDFVVNASPAVLITMVVYCVVFYLMFRKSLRVSRELRARIMDFDEKKALKDKGLLIKSLSIISLTILGFSLHGVLHVEPATVALGGAALLMLLTGEHEVDKFFHEVEWSTIFFFIGLFVMVDGLVAMGAIEILAKKALAITGGDIRSTSILLIWISGVFSAFVDNIPYVATMIPMVQHMGQQLGADAIMPLWWSLSLGACFGGNGTLIGASANVVSAGIAGKSGFKISFLTFTKYGAFITFLSLLIATVYIYLRYLI